MHCCWGSRSMLFCVANYQFGIIARRGGKTRNSRWSQEENVEQFVFVEATLIIQFAVAVGLWHCSESSVCCKTRYLSPIVCGYRAATQHEEKLRHKNKENISYTISQKKSSNNVQCELEGKVTTWFIQFFGLILNVRAHALFFSGCRNLIAFSSETL